MALDSIRDFTPGIRDVPSPNYPPGTLQSDGTFRCYARPDGSLAPLPRRRNNYFFLPEDAAGTATTLPVPTDWTSPLYISGLHCRNPVFTPGQNLDGVDQNNTEVLVGLEYFYTGPNSTPYKSHDLWRHTRDFDVPGWELIWRESRPGSQDPAVRPKRMSFVSGRTNSANANVAGPVSTAFCVDGRVLMYPDDTATTVDSTRYLPGDRELDASGGGLVSPDFIVGHQGRVVIFPLSLLGAGAFGTIWATNEAFYFTESNDWTTKPTDVEFFRQIVGWEEPTGYQAFGSLDADVLLLIKARGGGVVLQGDIGGSDIRADRHPSVRGTGLSMNAGTFSPVGFIYPVDGSGIWTWGGGDRSEHLTPTMPDDFWRPPADPFYGHGYTTADTWGDWVVLPNNWLLDLQPEVPALWRLDDPEDLIIHKMSSDWRSRFLYAAGESVENLGAAVTVEYDATVPASSFQARLHPLAASLGAELHINTIGIVATGRGRVTITARSRQHTAGETVTFSVDDDRFPTRMFRGCDISGSHIEFTVNSSAHSDEGESGTAPTVHELLWEANDAPSNEF